jgi:hypothetical protein
MEVKWVQLKNAAALMYVTEFGTIIDVTLVQAENASLPIPVTAYVVGISLEINVTEEGISISPKYSLVTELLLVPEKETSTVYGAELLVITKKKVFPLYTEVKLCAFTKLIPKTIKKQKKSILFNIKYKNLELIKKQRCCSY